jgi:hypothetical protein
VNALRDGIRRVNDAPAILLGVWLSMLGVSLPLAIAAQVPGDAGWLGELIDFTAGVGVRPPLAAVERFVDVTAGSLVDSLGPLTIVGVSYFAIWLFLAGGILDRYARDRATRAHGFFAACGVFFFRFLRLALAAAPAYWLVIAVARTRLPPDIYGTIALAALLAVVHLIVDYTEIRSVIEDRRSALNSIVAAVRFIAANAGAVITLYLADLLLFAIVVAAYSRMAPAGGGSGLAAWSTVAAAQLYLLARVWVRLVGWAVQVSLFQSRLAHAGYVARPQPAWPESPSAEAIRACGSGSR